MDEWIPIEEGRPPEDALILYYLRPGGYMWDIGGNFDAALKAWPDTTHWCIFINPPDSMQ